MDPGEQITGTRDEHYNLISILYHALHGAENCDTYAVDAEIAGDENLTAFFREAQAMHMALAEQAKGFLGIGGTTPGDITEGIRAGGATSESGVVSRAGSVQTDMPPGLGDVQREEQLVNDLPDEPPDTPAGDVAEVDVRERSSSEVRVPSEDIVGPEAPSRTEPTSEQVPPTGARGVPPALEEIPPERSAEIPTAEEVPSGTPPQAPPGDVQR